MQFDHLHFVRRGTALAVAAVLAGSAAACASAKKPAATDTQSVQPNAVRGEEGGDRGRGRRGGPGRGDMRLFEGITLSDSQRAKVDSIRTAYRDRMTAARENGGDREQFRQMMEEQRTAIRAVLTPEQQAKFDANVERMRNERGRRGPGGPGGSGS